MKKSIILSILALVGVFGALLLFSGEEQPAAKKQALPRSDLAKAPDPPKADPVVDDAALKDTLLGLNKKPEPVVEQQPAPRQHRRRVHRAIEEVEDLNDQPQDPTDLSDYDFQSTVGNWSGVKSCLATNTKRGEAKISGAIEVAFTISGEGNVVESKVVGFSNDDAATLVPCVEKKARHIRFPTFAKNEPITKTAKFVF